MSVSIDKRRPVLFLGVDGGGTRCRARLTEVDGRMLGEGIAGSANIRLGLNESLSGKPPTSACDRRDLPTAAMPSSPVLPWQELVNR